jgi:predicted dehydrogenase
MKNHAQSRRKFLTTAAAAALAPAMVPASALGRAQAAPNGKVNVAIIGVGGDRGGSHIQAFGRLRDKAHVVAVCDVRTPQRTARARMIDEIYGDTGCAEYNDFREVLERDDIDAVGIAVPDHWHALIAVAAARAGKHVYLEKPFAYTVREGRAIVDAVNRHGVVLQHGTQQRSMEHYLRVCELVRNGRLGEIHTIRVGSPYGKRGGSTERVPVPEGLDYDLWLGPAPHVPYTPGRCDGRAGEGWYHIRDYSGGWVTAWGSHDIDIAQWGDGTDDSSAVQIEGWGQYPTDGVYDTCWKWHVECRFANGVKLIYASEHENAHGVLFEGSEGRIFVQRDQQIVRAEPESLLHQAIGDNDIRLVASTDHFENFLDAIRDGAPLAAPAEIGHRTTTTCHLCNIAIALKRPLRWDPAHEQFVDDPDADSLLARPMRAPWQLG